MQYSMRAGWGRRGVCAAALLIASVLAAGCSVNRSMRADSYTVQRGDTLAAIAQQHGMNWHNLARWNHIGPPYRIRVGQHLALKPYPKLDYAHMPKAQPQQSGNAGGGRTRPEAANGQTQPLKSSGAPSVAATASSAHAGNAEENATGGGASSNQQAQQQATAGEEQSIDQASAKAQKSPVKAGGPSQDGWRWPASGPLLQKYNPSARRKGIEIGGQRGAPIVAASSGTVVYNGSGLKGYGRLIIIKHNAHYLSAYGFINRSLVKQGQTVAAGAKIAAMGMGPGNKPMLRFEIRHDGDPINPINRLPKR